MTLQQAYASAVEHHRAGRFAEADAFCRAILTTQPDHVDTLLLLGSIRRRTGQIDDAIALYRRASALRPESPDTHYSLGNALTARGDHIAAVAEFRSALQLRPNFPQAANNLGVAYAALEKFEDAAAAYRDALRLLPNSAEIHQNLGNVLMRLKQFDAAIVEHRDAVRLRPNDPAIRLNLGNALRARGDRVEAATEYHRVLELQPDYAEAAHNLGVTLFEMGKLEEAAAAYRRALNSKPDSPEIHTGLGNALMELRQHDAAISAHQRALQLWPEYPEAWNNLGNAFREKGDLGEAVAAYRRAVSLKPDYVQAHYNLGSALADNGELDEALAIYRRFRELAPGDSRIHSALILWLLHLPLMASENDIAEEEQRWNRWLSEAVGPATRPHCNDRTAVRRLRVGYVSADFRDQVVGWNIRPLLRGHDRTHFEIYCYSDVIQPDTLTEEFRGFADQWRNIAGLSDNAVAELIRKDTIDILVDLAQHTAGNRLPVFAQRPAPVQVSFAGYPESTGLEAIGHRLSDGWLEGRDREMEHGTWEMENPANGEQVHLLDSFWCYEPPEKELAVNALPALSKECVTFACLNRSSKVNDPILALWARVLREVPDSRLLLLCEDRSRRERWLTFFAEQGVPVQNVELIDRQERLEYLRLYHRVDVVLDTFPYNGHTTSLDALWMGVPVVSWVGRRPVSRGGWSQLSNLGLGELAAFTEDEYVCIAAELARDLPRLAHLRSTLRPRMEASVLMDANRFIHQIEDAFRSMWRQWCTDRT